MSDKSNNPVYSYRAAEELDNDSWGTLVKATPKGSTWDGVKPVFDAWESEYRGSTGLPLPAAWRSAKSVIKGALSHGVLLTDGDGKPLGKTAVETAIASAKGGILAEKDPLTVLDGLMQTAYTYAVKHGLNVQWELWEPTKKARS